MSEINITKNLRNKEKLETKEWYLFIGSHHKGPYSWVEVASFFGDEVTKDTLAWKEGAEEWKSISEWMIEEKPRKARKKPSRTIVKVDTEDSVEAKQALLREEKKQQKQKKRKSSKKIKVAELEPEIIIPPELFDESEEVLPPEVPRKIIKKKKPEARVKAKKAKSKKIGAPRPTVKPVSSPMEVQDLEHILGSVEIENKKKVEVQPPPVRPMRRIKERYFAPLIVSVLEKLNEFVSSLEVKGPRIIFPTVDLGLLIKTLGIPFSYMMRGILFLFSKITLKSAKIMAVMALVALISWAFLKEREVPVLARNEAIGIEDNNKFIKTTAIPLSKGIHFSFALAENGSDIWFSTNRPGTGKIQVTLSSMENKILGREKVMFRSEALIENYTGQLQIKNFVDGDQLVPGFYRVSLQGEDTGKNIAFYSILKEIDFLNFIDSIKAFSPTFDYRGIFLLTNEPHKEFIAKLKEFTRQEREKKTKHLTDILEKYRTFATLLDKLNTMYKFEVNKYKNGKEIDVFHRKYAKQLGPMLGGLTYDNSALETKLKEADSFTAAEYNKMVLFAQKIGGIASDMVRRTKAQGKILNKSKDSLIETFDARITHLISTANLNIFRLEETLKEI